MIAEKKAITASRPSQSKTISYRRSKLARCESARYDGYGSPRGDYTLWGPDSAGDAGEASCSVAVAEPIENTANRVAAATTVTPRKSYRPLRFAAMPGS